jgi:3-oxoacyl-[acyl-carrier-protein] synthase II
LNRQKVYIISSEVITPVGNSIELTMSAILKNISGIGKLERIKFNTSDWYHKSGEIKDFDDSSLPLKIKKSTFSTQLLFACLTNNFNKNPALFQNLLKEKILFIHCQGQGGIDTSSTQFTSHCNNQFEKISPRFFLNSMLGISSAEIVNHYKLKVETQLNSATCASGIIGLANLLRSLSYNEFGAGICLAAETPLTHLIINGFKNLGALSENLQPYSPQATGTVLAEGAATMILANEDFVSRYNSTPLAEILAIDVEQELSDILSTQTNSSFITNCLKKSNLTPHDSFVINGHGTGTSKGDSRELQTINSIQFGQPHHVYSLKGHLGHSLGASSLVEIALGIEFMKDGIVPGTRSQNLKSFKSNVLLNNLPIDLSYQHLLKLCFGFGGVNAACVFKKC